MVFRFVLAWLLVGGCCPPPPASPGPGAVLQRYTESVRDGRLEEAYRLLSPRARKHLSEEAFRSFVAAGGTRLKQAISELATGGGRATGMTITFRHDDQVIVLVADDGTWRVDAGSVLPGAGITPEMAVDEFLRAIEAGDCQALLASAPPAKRASLPARKIEEGCRAQMTTLRETAARVRASGAKPVLMAPGRAELTYHQDHKLIVVEYQGRWYIEDL